MSPYDVFLRELTADQASGVAFKNIYQKKALLAHFAHAGNATLAELARSLGLSIPKVTALVGELIEEGLAQDCGKEESSGGRRPQLYGLAPDSGFFLGVDVKQDHLNLGLADFQKNLVHLEEHLPYHLANHPDSLRALCQSIEAFIGRLPVPRGKILGLGVNLSGRINYATGYSYSFFHFQEDPLSQMLEKELRMPVFLENDSRAMAFGEFSAGVVQQEKNVLFLNLDYGLGVGILIDGQLYYGKSGYAGEFGHIPLFDNELICHCGKKGCLETEASGRALVARFAERLQNGSSSLVTGLLAEGEAVRLEHILQAALDDDVLAIELLGEVGEKLGRGIALLINLFNPELVVLGGAMAITGPYIRLPIKSAIHKYSLSLVNNDTQLRMSALGDRAGVVGACLLARSRLLTQTPAGL